MVRPAIVALFLVFLVGCSDPAGSRLSPGAEVMIREPAPDPKRPVSPKVKIGDTEIDEYPVLSPGRVHTKQVGTLTHYAVAGTKARVISDDAPSEIKAAEPGYDDLDGVVDRRWVKVLFLEGSLESKLFEVRRNMLRPLGK